MIRKLDEITSRLNQLIGYIEMTESQYLKIEDNKYWVDEALEVVNEVEEVREFLNDLRMDL